MGPTFLRNWSRDVDYFWPGLPFHDYTNHFGGFACSSQTSCEKNEKTYQS